MSVNGRWQALEFRLDAMVVVVIQIGDQFLLEVPQRLKFLKIVQFTLEQAEEVFTSLFKLFCKAA